MIDDGFRYRDIINALGPPGTPELPYSISEMNLSNWRKGGYRDYRRRRDQLEFDRAHPSPASIFLEHSRQFREKLAKVGQASRLPTDTSPLNSPEPHLNLAQPAHAPLKLQLSPPVSAAPIPAGLSPAASPPATPVLGPPNTSPADTPAKRPFTIPFLRFLGRCSWKRAPAGATGP
jgi:hypothetical protein